MSNCTWKARWVALVVLITELSVSACGPAYDWHPLRVPPVSLRKYPQVRVWRGDSVTYLLNAVIWGDSVRGLPATPSWETQGRCVHDTCRISLSLGGVDSVSGASLKSSVLPLTVAALVVVIAADLWYAKNVEAKH